MSPRRLTPTERMVAAEARAVEEGHHARLAVDGRAFLVRSDTWDALDYRVRVTAVGETVVFTCDHSCYRASSGTPIPGAVPSRTFVSCKHGALAARRLEREGLLRWDGTAWRPTARAVELGTAAAQPADPFEGLPK